MSVTARPMNSSSFAWSGCGCVAMAFFSSSVVVCGWIPALRRAKWVRNDAWHAGTSPAATHPPDAVFVTLLPGRPLPLFLTLSEGDEPHRRLVYSRSELLGTPSGRSSDKI